MVSRRVPGLEVADRPLVDRDALHGLGGTDVVGDDHAVEAELLAEQVADDDGEKTAGAVGSIWV